ncbi:MAG: DUF928 domain-containing protein [Cyanobacteriota bacterium]|nr:DUF928 domain-containing protein [Cyanobacteriota bacterium]
MLFDRWTLSASALAALLSPALVGFAPLPSPETNSFAAPTLVSLDFPASPSNGRRPERTASGGARSLCYIEGRRQQAIPMTVLMPEDNVGTTVDDDPALFLYIPKSRIDGGQVIVFERESDREVYLREFDLSNKPGDTAGVIKIDLQEANLESGKIYDWVFSPFCLDEDGGTEFLGDTYVEGSFQRTELTSVQNTQLERAETLLEQAEIYARSGVWNETLSLAEQLRSSDPQEWTNLLKSVKLEELAEAPYFGEAPLIAEDDESGAEAILPDFSEPEETNAQPDRDTAPF